MRIKYSLKYENGCAICSNYVGIEDILIANEWSKVENSYIKVCTRNQYEAELLKLNKIANTPPFGANNYRGPRVKWIIGINGTKPSKREEDLGYDIYAAKIENLDQEKYADFFKHVKQGSLVMEPGEIVGVPTDIKTQIDKGYGFIVKERGSTGSKGLSVRCGVIDSGYRGEWIIFLNNTSDKTVVYDLNRAIAQAVIVKNYIAVEIEYDLGDSERGEGKLGSSGK